MILFEQIILLKGVLIFMILKDSFILVRSLFVIDYIFLFFISKSLFDTFQTNIRTRQFFNFSIFDCSITNNHGMEEEINRQPEYCQIDCFVEIFWRIGLRIGEN